GSWPVPNSNRPDFHVKSNSTLGQMPANVTYLPNTDIEGNLRTGETVGAYDLGDGVPPTATPTGTQGPTSTPTDTPLPPTNTPTPTSTPEGGGTELLVNGGFEDATVDPWTLKNGAGDKKKCNTVDPLKTVSHTGDCAFRFKGGVPELTKLQQIVNLTGLTFATGNTIDLSIFVNAPKPNTAGKIKVRVIYGDSTETGKINSPLAVTNGYQETVGEVILSSGNVTKIKVQIKNSSPSGKFYVDDVSLLLYTVGESRLISLQTLH
ncbi:MAG TPA: hypothetical protein VHL11_02115, partial [Phototrophicaceae bacterium]|nr:hypothetical protein [Phototrophicaceae bacterium]